MAQKKSRSAAFVAKVFYPLKLLAEGQTRAEQGNQKKKKSSWKGAHTSLAGLAMSEKAGIDILAVWERGIQDELQTKAKGRMIAVC